MKSHMVVIEGKEYKYDELGYELEYPFLYEKLDMNQVVAMGDYIAKASVKALRLAYVNSGFKKADSIVPGTSFLFVNHKASDEEKNIIFEESEKITAHLVNAIESGLIGGKHWVNYFEKRPEYGENYYQFKSSLVNIENEVFAYLYVITSRQLYTFVKKYIDEKGYEYEAVSYVPDFAQNLIM